MGDSVRYVDEAGISGRTQLDAGIGGSRLQQETLRVQRCQIRHQAHEGGRGAAIGRSRGVRELRHRHDGREAVLRGNNALVTLSGNSTRKMKQKPSRAYANTPSSIVESDTAQRKGRRWLDQQACQRHGTPCRCRSLWQGVCGRGASGCWVQGAVQARVSVHAAVRAALA